MLRRIIFGLGLGVCTIACGPAADPAVGMAVRGDDGTLLGYVTEVERDSDGRIVAAEIEGLAPADAPDVSNGLLAEEDTPFWVRT